MKRTLWPGVVVLALTVAACGSATRPASTPTGSAAAAPASKLVVWDWKSGEPYAKTYIEKAKADFAKKHPNVTVEFVPQPFEQYYTLLGAAMQTKTGPDVMLFNGGGQIRDRADSLLPLDEYVAEDKSRLAGWEAFAKDGKTYGAPVTLQGHPIYYNKALYEKAGITAPATTWDEFLANCDKLKKATGAACFALGNKEGIGPQFWLSGMGSGVLTPAEYDDWIAGKRDWKSPHVKKIFEMFKETGDKKLNNEGANSTAMFTDIFSVFNTGKAAHIIGLMSDIGHWKDFGEFIGPDKVGIMLAPVVTDGATPSLPYDGGIGYAVAKWTKDPKAAADLVRSLTTTDALSSFSAEAGAIASDTTISAPQDAPVVGEIVAQLKAGKPALHVAMDSKTIDLMGRLSQKLLSGSATVDEAVEELAASDQEN